MRGDHDYIGLYMNPASNIPDLKKGSSGVIVKPELADEFDMWNSTKIGVGSHLFMNPPIIKVTAQRGYPTRHTERIAPITVGNIDQLKAQQERKDMIDKTRRRVCV